jgi:hypothetical protein
MGRRMMTPKMEKVRGRKGEKMKSGIMVNSRKIVHVQCAS